MNGTSDDERVVFLDAFRGSRERPRSRREDLRALVRSLSPAERAYVREAAEVALAEGAADDVKAPGAAT